MIKEYLSGNPLMGDSLTLPSATGASTVEDSLPGEAVA